MDQNARLALSLCKDIETICAEIYFYYAEAFADQPDVRNLWEKTAFEEKNHANLLKIALNWKNLELADRAYDLPKFRNFKSIVQGINENVRKSKPQLKESLRSSISLEKKLQEFHVECVVSFKYQAEEKLFAALLKGDKEHIADLERAYESVLRTGTIRKALPPE